MARTAAEIQADLDEINSELSDMIGAPGFTIGGMTVDERGLHERLMQRKADCEFALATLANTGSAEQNASNSSRRGGW